jgi:L-lactate dehydrogenase
MKVGIIGSGLVGATAGYALVMRGVGREVVLVDLDKKRSMAEADDIFHAVPFAHPMNINAGDYEDLAGCRVVIIAAGVGQKPGETRLQLLSRNADVFRQVVPNILKYAPDAVLLVATNPVDIMTHMTAEFAKELGVPSSRVIGSGTTLDTARFRVLLGRYVGVDPHHVHAYVIGEHGDSEVLPWSLVTVAGRPIEEFCEQRGISLDYEDRKKIINGVRNAAYTIIEGKGATYYGIGSALARIVEVILSDQRAILTVCTPVEDVEGIKDVTLALPNLIGGEGIIETFPQPLSDVEREKLRTSAQIIRSAIDGLT